MSRRWGTAASIAAIAALVTKCKGQRHVLQRRTPQSSELVAVTDSALLD